MDSLNTIFLWTLNTIQTRNSFPDGEKGIGKNVTSNFQTLKWETRPSQVSSEAAQAKPHWSPGWTGSPSRATLLPVRVDFRQGRAPRA